MFSTTPWFQAIRRSLTAALAGFASTLAAAAPTSFDCTSQRPGSIESLVCQDPALVQLDQALAATYAQAAKLAHQQKPNLLPAEQRGWIKGRNDCWKDSDPRACVAWAYRRRNAELQARYRLLPGTGPVRYICDGQPTNQVLATYFNTDPATLVAERGDQVALMFQQPTASGSRYAGRNESLREHQGEASIVWGFGAAPMRCLLQR